jgi:lipopolysaccharide transport system permease protein
MLINFGFAELWRARELLYFLAWRDVKVRYKQTALGVFWVLLQPILTTLIFTVLLARFAPEQNAAVSYSLLIFCGFVLWSFTGNALTNAANSLVNHTNLITKVYFPRLVMPLAAVLATTLDLLISLAVLFAVLLFGGVRFSANWLFAPIFVVLLIVFVFALGTLLAAVNVRFRDVRFALPFFLQLLLFATPVFYTLDFLPERARSWWKLNPLTGIFDGFRAAVLGTAFDLTAILISVVFTFFLLIFAVVVFRRMEDDFADVV